MKNLNTIAIRGYAQADLPALVELFRAAVRNANGYDEAQRLAWAPDIIDEATFDARRRAQPTWIAVIDDTIAGFTDLGPDGHIDMLYVHPDFGGRDVARALLNHAETVARQNGNRQLYSEVSITARPVFERLGFTVETAQTVMHNGADFINYRMTKELSAEK